MSGVEHVLTATQIRFAYGTAPDVLCGVDLSAAAGDLLCMLGPNGCGKTTLLRCLLGLLRPKSGEILLDGRPIERYSPKALARLIAYVPQIPLSTFAFTVEELVFMGRFAHAGVLGLTARQDWNIARAAMEMTDTLRFADRTLDELSGGEAQRVMIARALAQQPSVMLLDEPTSSLDPANQLKVYRMMRRLAHEWRMAVVCVSHDVNTAARFADRLFFMRDGKMVAAGRPEEVIRAEILRETYGVPIRLIDAAELRVPLVSVEEPKGESSDE